MEAIKVSATSRTSAVAGAIAGVVREHHRAVVQAIGYLKGDGIYVSCVPEFVDVTIEDKVRTAIKLVIEPSGNGQSVDHSAAKSSVLAEA